MDPITGIGLILSLIPLFQRERDKREAASKEEFYSWLIGHKFQDVKDCITNNFALAVEIENLLRGNQDILLQRFNAVDEQLLRILHSVEGFQKIAEVISPAACLTQRQQDLLSVMVHTGGTQFISISAHQGFCGFRADNGKSISPKDIDTKFLEPTLIKLCEVGFLMWNGRNTYYLTESGQDYVDNLDKKSEQEI